MVNNFFKGVVHLPSDEAFSILKETGEYSDGNISVKYDPLSWIYITPTLNAITLNSNQTITGRKTFTESIYLANTDGTVDRIAHINNNFVIYSGVSNGLALLNIDEGLGKISAFNKELAFKEDIAASANGSLITVDGEIQPMWEANTKVSKMEGAAGFTRVYTNTSGVDGFLNVLSTDLDVAAAWAVPRYNEGGTLAAGTPTLGTHAVNKNYADDNYLSKSGGVINGDITITGNIIQQGETYETHAEKVYSTNDYIYLREGNTGGLAEGAYTGFEFVKYDGTNNGRLVIDNKGIARVGDVGDEQPLATREESPIDGALVKWDASTNKFITDETNYLPVSGGTTTGTINHNGTLNTNLLSVRAMTYRYKFGPLNTVVGHLACSGVNATTGSTVWTYKLIDTTGKLYSQGNEVALKTDIINYIDTTGAASGSITFNKAGTGFTFVAKDGVEFFVYGDGVNYSRLYTQIKAADGAMNYYPLMDENGKLYSEKNEVITTAGGTMTGILKIEPSGSSIFDTSKGIKFGNTIGHISGNTNGQIGITTTGLYVRINDTTEAVLNGDTFKPNSNDGLSLGASNYRWKEIYGTTIYQNGNKVLDVSGGTLTGDINLGTQYGFMGTTTSGNPFDIFRVSSSNGILQIGGSYPALQLKGKNTRPTYNDGEMALMSDIPTITFDESTGVLTITG